MAESIIGTWVFNDEINTYDLGTFYINFNSVLTSGGTTKTNFIKIKVSDGSISYSYKSGSTTTVTEQVFDSGSWNDVNCSTITIIDGADITNETFITWLKANATKQEPTLVRRFTRLFLGDTVATSGTKVFKKLTTEEPQDDSIVGTWVFNDSITRPDVIYYVDFTCYIDDVLRTCTMLFGYGTSTMYYGGVSGYSSSVQTYNSGRWIQESYKTINITSTIATNSDSTSDLTSSLLSWLKTNATKQTSSTISFTIGGTTYQADEGMTWAEWCDSEYNTGGWYVVEQTDDQADSICSTASGMKHYIESVTKDDVITAGTVYVTEVRAGGSND